MVIGAFFSEAGTSILKMLSSFDAKSCQITNQLLLDETWEAKDFENACQHLNSATYQFHCSKEDLEVLRSALLQKRNFLLRLLENPNLLEHDTFTELLWAVFHLTEELAARGDLLLLPDSDIEHLMGDVNRVYAALTRQWLSYMEHLRSDYPFLFSFAMRTNPFNPDASVEVTKTI